MLEYLVLTPGLALQQTLQLGVLLPWLETWPWQRVPDGKDGRAAPIITKLPFLKHGNLTFVLILFVICVVAAAIFQVKVRETSLKSTLSLFLLPIIKENKEMWFFLIKYWWLQITVLGKLGSRANCPIFLIRELGPRRVGRMSWVPVRGMICLFGTRLART